MTLRRKLLILFALATAIPVLVSAALSVRVAEKALDRAVTELHTRAAIAEAEAAEQLVHAFGIELSAAVQYEDPKSLSPAAEQEFLTRVFLRRNRISIVALLTPEARIHGTVFVDDPEAFARQEPQFRLHDTVNAAEAEDFRVHAAALLGRAKPGQAFLVSDPYLTLSRNKPAVVVVAPSLRPGGMALAAELSLDELLDRVAQRYGDQGSVAFLLDRQGKLFIDRDLARVRSRKDYSQRLGSALAHGGTSLVRFTDGGIAYLAAVSRSEELGWTAVVARPQELASAPLRALFRAALWVLLFALVVVGVTAVLMARALARPIAELAGGAAEFTRGNLSHRIQLDRADELGALARAFNAMGRSMEEANDKLVRFNEELKHQVDERTHELKLAQQQLLRSQRLAAVGDLATGLAHEVNNPLAAIVGNAQLLLEDSPKQGLTREMLGDVVSQALRISDLVRDLQSLAEAQKGGLSTVDVHQVLHRVVSAQNQELSTDGIAVKTDFKGASAAILGDEPALREVFGHLLSNSRNALQGRTEKAITIATSSIEGEAVMIEVSDTGRGIPRENLERIFNPFFTTKQQWTGRGLALSICHRIIENHGGKISVQSEEGVGTTVTVVLPAAPPRAHLR